jgi:uncharacterized protein YeaO (DUF488 family)
MGRPHSHLYLLRYVTNLSNEPVKCLYAALKTAEDPERKEESTMSISIIRLGSPRRSGEGVRIGTVRRPPRGVPKEQWAKRDYYDVWYPVLAPSAKLMSAVRAALTQKNARAWKSFSREYRAEMSQPGASRTLDVLAALSASANFSVGCYCEDEHWCHRSILRELLMQRGAKIRSQKP